MKKRGNYKRKDFFIKKWFQFKFTLIFITAIIVSNAIYGSYIFNNVKKYLSYHLYRSHTNLSNTWEIISPVFIKTSIWAVFILFFLFIFIIYLITRKYSNGFKVLLKDLLMVNSGDLTSDFSISKYKAIEVVSKDYKEVKTLLRTNIHEAKESIKKLSALADKLETYANDKADKGIIASVEEMEFYYRKLQNNIDKIRIPEGKQ